MKILLLLVAALSLGAETPSAIALRNARIVTVSGPDIENGTVVIRDGKIEAVGTSVNVPAGAQTIDGHGLSVYPGMIDAGTVLGLIGTFNAVAGIAALSGSAVYRSHGVFEFGNVRLWGWIVLIAGLAELVASFAIFSKSSFARWFGVASPTG